MDDSPGLEGDPIYVPESPGYHTYPYGYGSPPPLVATARRTDPRIGWLLVVVGLVALAGSLLPWFHLVAPIEPDATYVSDLPDERGGLVAVALSLLIMAVGLWIGVRRGDLWSPILALTATAIGIFLTLLAIAGEQAFNAFAFDDEPTASIGPGLWLHLVACAAALGFSIVALTRRRPVQDVR